MATESDHPKEDPPKPPAELFDRVAVAAPDVVNTYEVPCDPRDPDAERWFDKNVNPPMRAGNRVTALVNGAESFALMVDAIETAKTQDDYIYMCNWWVDLDFELRHSRPPTGGALTTKLWDLLLVAVSKGVQVRALFWDQPGTQNDAEGRKLDTLRNAAIPGANGAAILDDNTCGRFVGSHHQKLLVLKGGEQVIGFCGGVDFNDDRIAMVPRQAGSPMHDVHCRIIGPAAYDLLQIFVDRWNDHPDSPAIDKAKGPLRAVVPVPPPAGTGDKYVQIGRTYGNGKAHPGIKNKFGGNFYSFAPTGEQTARAVIFKGIQQARQYIYVQDQYLQSMEASTELLKALPNIKKLVILIPHPSINDHPNIWRFQKAFVDPLLTDPKVAVCYLKEAGAVPNPKSVPATSFATYVHAKCWIMDDKFAVIGSANCNNRGYTHDSESVAAIYDESRDSPCTLHFAHALRIRLWALHLNLKPADVFDPIGSAAHWFAPTVGSRIGKFDQNADKDSPWLPRNMVPDSLSEPIGS